VQLQNCSQTLRIRIMIYKSKITWSAWLLCNTINENRDVHTIRQWTDSREILAYLLPVWQLDYQLLVVQQRSLPWRSQAFPAVHQHLTQYQPAVLLPAAPLHSLATWNKLVLHPCKNFDNFCTEQYFCLYPTTTRNNRPITCTVLTNNKCFSWQKRCNAEMWKNDNNLIKYRQVHTTLSASLIEDSHRPKCLV